LDDQGSPAESVGIGRGGLTSSVDDNHIGWQLDHFTLDDIRLQGSDQNLLLVAAAFIITSSSSSSSCRRQLPPSPEPGVALTVFSLHGQHQLEQNQQQFTVALNRFILILRV